MRPSLQLRLGHQVTMTPHLQQAIRLLQLSSVELQNEIEVALQTNSMLERDESSADESSGDDFEPSSESEEILSREQDKLQETPADEYLMGQPDQTSFRESLGNEIETLNHAHTTLRDHLTWQMELTPFTEVDHLIATALIDAINESGFLTSSIDDIVATLPRDIDAGTTEVETVLHRIQHFDPIGVGARDLRECLEIQLARLSPPHPLQAKATLLVKYHLDILAKHNYTLLKRRLGVTSAELQSVIELIQSLNPRPGSQIGEEAPEFVVPDVIAHKVGQQWIVTLNPRCQTPLKINTHYAAFIRRADSSLDNQFLRSQLQEARWLLKSIKNRDETLLKVARCIVDIQQNFLDHGAEAMKPLTLHDIAKSCQLHESTISRITTQKYLYTPRGTFELKYFFSSHLSTEAGGECSSTAIRALIKKLITQENRQKPLSDSKLSKFLAEQGINVARRTVAKYREEMSIPPSSERKVLS